MIEKCMKGRSSLQIYKTIQDYRVQSMRRVPIIWKGNYKCAIVKKETNLFVAHLHMCSNNAFGWVISCPSVYHGRAEQRNV